MKADADIDQDHFLGNAPSQLGHSPRAVSAHERQVFSRTCWTDSINMRLEDLPTVHTASCVIEAVGRCSRRTVI